MNPFSCRLTSLLFLTLSCATAALCAAKPSPTDNTVVSLSAFEVTAERIDFHKWTKVTSPHFVIYTDASVKETRLLAKHLEMTEAAVQFYFRRAMRTEPPLIVILPTTQSDWRKVTSTATQWKPVATLLQESRALVVLEDDWQENPGYLLAMVGKHSCDLMNIEGPTWFSTGLAAFFGTITFSGDTLKIGEAGMWSAPVIRYGFMKWDRFFEVTVDSPEFYADSIEHQRYHGQATAFVHYLLTRPDKASVGKLLEWASICDGKGNPSEQDFQKIFGENYKGMERDINKLLSGGEYMSNKISFQPQALKFNIEDEPARPKEMRELFVLAQAMVQQGPDSLAAVDAILKNGLKNESLRELLADSCLCRGRGEEALKQYQQLVAAGTTNAAVFEKVAALQLREKSVTDRVDHYLGAEQEGLEKLARRATELDPLFFEAYSTLAWIHATGATVKPEDVATISQICHALNGKARTDQALAALAVAYWRSGDKRKADQIDTLLVGSPYTRPEARKIAKDLKARLAASPGPAGR